MDMELRNDSRCETALHAVVSCPRFGLFRGAVENLSRRGMYVCTHNVSMCLNSAVTITLQRDPEEPTSCCEAQGVVVHVDQHGFGVRFTRLDAYCEQMLADVLAASGHPFEERLAV
jgi:hypothetical protein